MVCWTIPALHVAAEDHRLTTNPTWPPAVSDEKYHGGFFFPKTVQVLGHISLFCTCDLNHAISVPT